MSKNGYNLITYAQHSDNPEILKFLVKNDVDPHARYDDEYNALYTSSSKGYYNSVKYLLSIGCKHKEALSIAEENGHAEIVKLLKKHMDNI